MMVILDSILKAEAKNIACEIEGIGFWSQEMGEFKTCYIKQAPIESTGVKFSTNDATINGLDLSNNLKMFYLPENVGESFPNLIGYSVQRCSVKHVLKLNFNGLKKVKELLLTYNQIEKIENSVFDDLVSLERIWLGE
jgi:hypothetical protein